MDRTLVRGWVMVIRLLLTPATWRSIRRIAAISIRRHAEPTYGEPIFVLLTGHPGAGKTTLCRQHPVLSHFAHFDCDRFHDLMTIEWPKLFAKGEEHRSFRWPRSALVSLGLVTVFWNFRQRREALVYDYVNYNRWRRRMAFLMMRSFGYRCGTIWVTCAQDVRAERLRRDHSRQSPVRQDALHRLIEFQPIAGKGPPTPSPGEIFIRYESDRLRPEELNVSALLPSARSPELGDVAPSPVVPIS